MSNAAHALLPRIAVIASAIANARAARNGSVELDRVLDILCEPDFVELVDEAYAVARALDAFALTEAATPRAAGPLNLADADALRLDLDAGTVLILVRDRSGRARAALTAVAVEGTVLGHDEAQALWVAAAAVLRRLPDSPPALSDQPEA